MNFDALLDQLHDAYQGRPFAMLPENVQYELAVAWYAENPLDLGEVAAPRSLWHAIVMAKRDEAHAGRLLRVAVLESVLSHLARRWAAHEECHV